MRCRYAAALLAAALCPAVLGDDVQCLAEFTNFLTPKEVPPDLAQRVQSLAANIMRTIQETMRTDFNYIHGATDLFVTIPKAGLTGEAFDRFTLPGKSGGSFNSSMKVIEFVPRVLHNNTDPAFSSLFTNRSTTQADPWWTKQETYKAYALKARGSDKYVFTELAKGQRVVRQDRPEYYPVQYVQPIATNEAAVGYDLGSNAARLEALKVAEKTAGIVITSRIQLVQSTYEQYGFLLWSPVFQDVMDPSIFTLPRRLPGVPAERLWPAGHLVAGYVVQDLLQKALGVPALSTLAGPAYAGASVMTLVFQKVGYADSANASHLRPWEFLAGFAASLNVSNTSFMQDFNRDWKLNREARLDIVAHQLLCETLAVDEAGSKWHIVFAVDYGCQEGEYLVAAGVPGQNLSVCAPCPPGLRCSGLADGAPFEVPAGRFAPSWDEVAGTASVYECRPADVCPGGPAGACAGGRMGVPCAECPRGQSWSGERCEPCTESTAVVWVFVLAGLVGGMVAIYYTGKKPISERPGIAVAVATSVGIGLTQMQVASILRLVPIGWPDSIAASTQGCSWVMLDTETLNLACVIGDSAMARYLATALVFPAAIGCLALLKVAFGAIPRASRFAAHRWAWPETFSAMGEVMRMVFTTMCNIALMPFMCYRHPNGKRSVLKYTSVICGEGGDHATMQAFGVLLLLLCAAFLSLLLTASWLAPRWSTRGDTGAVRLRAFRFLLSRFRGDSWWFGSFLVLRGLALSLPVALATDSAVTQLLAICLILLVSQCVQVYLWPWKVPVANYLEAFTTMLLILVIAWSSFYAPHVSQGSILHLDRLGLAILGILIFTVVLVALWASLFFLKYNVMGRRLENAGRSAINAALGEPQNGKDLANKLHHLAIHLSEVGSEATEQLLQALSIYDFQAVATVVTILGALSGSLDLQVCRRVMPKSSDKLPTISVDSLPSARDLSPVSGATQARLGRVTFVAV